MIKQTFEVSKAVKDRTQSDVLSALTEEVGELSTEIRVKTGLSYKLPGKDGIIGEAIDVILCALDIIYLENPNITEEQVNNIVGRKLAKWKEKAS